MERLLSKLNRFLYRLKQFAYQQYVQDLLDFYQRPLHLRILQTSLFFVFVSLLAVRFSLLGISVKNDWPSYLAIDTTLNALIKRHRYDPELLFSMAIVILFCIFFYCKVKFQLNKTVRRILHHLVIDCYRQFVTDNHHLMVVLFENPTPTNLIRFLFTLDRGYDPVTGNNVLSFRRQIAVLPGLSNRIRARLILTVILCNVVHPIMRLILGMLN